MQTITLQKFLNKLDICAGVVIDGYFTYSYSDLNKSAYFEIYANDTEYKFWYVDNSNPEVYNNGDHMAFAKLVDIDKNVHHVSLLTYMQL